MYSLSPETLRGSLDVHPWIEHPALPGRTNHLRAGVLVPLIWEQDRLLTLLQLRPPTLRRHGGEVSFPGGRAEPEDTSVEHTARRECQEELGLKTFDMLGRLSSMPVYTSDFRLEPFVARACIDELDPDPGEVAEVLRVDLGALLDADHTEAIGGLAGGAFPALPVYRVDGWVVFGATALTLLELLTVLARAQGRSVPDMREGDLTPDQLFTLGAAAGKRR